MADSSWVLWETDTKSVQRPHPPIWVGGNSRRAMRRAVELADGWVPFQVTLDDVADRLDYARTLADHEHPLDVVVPAGPVEISRAPIDGDRDPFTGSQEQVLEDIAEFERAGVTGMTVGFKAPSLNDYLEQMATFASEISANVH